MNPWIVEITRGDRVESTSIGHGVVLSANGQPLLSFGDLHGRLFHDRLLNGSKDSNWY